MGVAALAACAGTAAAQCQPGWQNDFGIPGANDTVYSTTMWDPDGPGPRTPVLVFGGKFVQVGNSASSCVATYDPATGEVHTLGNLSFYTYGQPVGVFALGVLSNGDLVAGGQFLDNASARDFSVARWNGSAWEKLGGAPSGVVYAIQTMSNGDVYFGGTNSTSGRGSPSLAKWRDGVWTTISTQGSLPIGSITERPNGNPVICSLGRTGIGSGFISELTPTGWTSLLAPGDYTSRPYAIRSLSNGDLIAVGSNLAVAEGAAVNTVTNVARYDGTTWHRLGPANQFPNCAFGSVVSDILELPDGRLVVGGTFRESVPYQFDDIRVWDGAAWSSLPDHIGTSYDSGDVGEQIRTLARLPDGSLFAGGNFRSTKTPTSTPISNIARFDGSQWRRMAGGFSSGTQNDYAAVRFLRDGRAYAFGNFTWAGNQPALNAAILDGENWSQFPGGALSGVADAAALTDGSLVFSGTFTTAGGIAVNGLVRWTPQSGFENIGDPSGGSGGITSILALPTGGFIVSGSFNAIGGVPANNIAFWNGGVWYPLSSGLDAAATKMTVSPLGGFIAVGNFTQAGDTPANHIARWDGSRWSGFGEGVPAPRDVAAGADGRIFVSAPLQPGSSTLSGLEWNGSAWVPAQGDLASPVLALASTEEGDVFYITSTHAPLYISPARERRPAFGLLNGDQTNPISFLSTSLNYSLRGAAGHQVGFSSAVGLITLRSAADGAFQQSPLGLARYVLQCAPVCDPDENQDGVADQGDVDYLVNVITGGGNPTNIDPDFNRDGATDQGDVDALVNVIAGGACP